MVAPVPGFSLAALARFSAALPLPEAAPAPDRQSRVPDVIVFSSAPMRLLSDLASAGLRQLAALLPMIEQAVQNESTVPLGHLAKAAGAAARQIVDGHEALLAEGPDRVAASVRGRGIVPASATPDTQPSLRTLARQIGSQPVPAEPRQPSDILRTIARQLGSAELPEPKSPAEPIQHWLIEAKHLLRSTGEALDRADDQLRPQLAADPASVAAGSSSRWVMTEIMAAQAQIALSYAAVSRVGTPTRTRDRVMPLTSSLDHLAGATTLFGMLLVLATLWLIGGLWSVAAGIAALAGAALWIWRVNRASLGLMLP